MRDDNRVWALMLPVAMVGGWAAGAFTARYMVRREMEKLRGAIEGARAPQPAPTPVRQPAPAPEPVEEEISPETLMVLSAAVAAFLGKRARIRGARLLRTGAPSPWAQEGRVYIQASHALQRT